MEYEAVIGLEMHVQLKTKFRMCCDCTNQYGAQPITNVGPAGLDLICESPVATKQALRLTEPRA
jgi:aspartyl-tRNA(Asn)/glutamyl-tRNA(Gln) amidotransferase subunit B